jgi:hypothetical protein
MMSYFATHDLYKLKMKTSHYLVLTLLSVSACKGQNKETEPMEQTHLFTNELIHETSPYLLQHALRKLVSLGWKAFQKPKKKINW